MMIENQAGSEYTPERDQLLCQSSHTSNNLVNSICYLDVQAPRYDPTYDLTLTPDYADLREIPSQDLLPTYAENSECINDLYIQERNDIKAKHHVLPDLEEHDKGGFNFDINHQWSKHAKWLFSTVQKRIYIKTNEIIPLQVFFKPNTRNEEFFVRIMMVYNSEVSEPVVRCENHSSKDTAKEKNVKHSVVRCENSDVSYEGSIEGKNISDRLSILVPLRCIPSNDDGLVKQTIALKFVCQNSCVGRRETSMIFHLEDSNGEILAKRIIAIKICSCPKRDMKKDETTCPKKRSANDNCPVGKKIPKMEDISEVKKELKQELDDEDSSGSAPTPTDMDDVVITSNGIKITLDLPDHDAVLHVLDCAFNKLAGQVALNPDNKNAYLKMRAMKKLYSKLRQVDHGQK